MKALVVGYGSIGSRHAKILKELDCDVWVVTSRECEDFPRSSTVPGALRSGKFDYAVIANKTADHFAALNALKEGGHRGAVLIEKPVFDKLPETKNALNASTFSSVSVAYNLRFHPALSALRRSIANEKIISVQACVGQYLPDWRKDRPYAESYSVSKAQGGGVLRDLSHEIDYISWIFGKWTRLAALGGHFSPLIGDSEDTVALLMQTEKTPVLTLQLNYLDRQGRREIVVNTEKGTITVDLLNHAFHRNEETESFPLDRDSTYREQHRALLSGKSHLGCSLEEGLETLRTIEAAEKAIASGKWLEN